MLRHIRLLDDDDDDDDDVSISITRST